MISSCGHQFQTFILLIIIIHLLLYNLVIRQPLRDNGDHNSNLPQQCGRTLERHLGTVMVAQTPSTLARWRQQTPMPRALSKMVLKYNFRRYQHLPSSVTCMRSESISRAALLWHFVYLESWVSTRVSRATSRSGTQLCRTISGSTLSAELSGSCGARILSS